MADLHIPIAPPEEWFRPPADGIPTDRRITIQADGRVFGYIALWNTCHVGMQGCVTPPKGSPSDYEYAHQGETMTAGGTIIKTAVIGGGAGHAPIDMKTANVPAYYENIDTQLMRVRYGQDDNGLYFAGALWPTVSELQVAHIRASSVSGDWRWHAAWRKSGGNYDFAGACFVNIPGFPMPSAGDNTEMAGTPYALAASAYVPITDGDEYIFMDGEIITAGALPFKASTKADPSTEWDGPVIKTKLNTKEMLRMANAWVDPSGDPEAKSSYKLPHHLPDGRVVLRGVEAAMGALLGARGGVDIPEVDKMAVYNHLAKHYRQFDKEPPKMNMTASAGDDTVGCNGNEAECGCTAASCTQVDDIVEDDVVASATDEVADDELSDEDILAAVYQLMGKRRKKNGSITADASTDATPVDVTPSLQELSDSIQYIKNAVDWLVSDKLVEDIAESVDSQQQ